MYVCISFVIRNRRFSCNKHAIYSTKRVVHMNVSFVTWAKQSLLKLYARRVQNEKKNKKEKIVDFNGF